LNGDAETAIQADSNSDIRSKLLKFGNLLSSQIAGKTDPNEVKAVIDTEVRKVLNKLREFNPRDYYRRCKIAELEASIALLLAPLSGADKRSQPCSRSGVKHFQCRMIETSVPCIHGWITGPLLGG
jgi:hypothetical protein